MSLASGLKTTMFVSLGVASGLLWSRLLPGAGPAPAAPAVDEKRSERRRGVDLVESARRERQWFAAAVRDHGAESVDASWAPRVSAAFRGDLLLLRDRKQLGYDVVSADCRRDTCVGDLAWSSPSRARADMPALATHAYHANCRRRVYLHDGEVHPDGRHHADLILECQQWKAEGSRELSVPPNGS